MGGLNKCAILGCRINSLPRHRFPNFRKDFPRFQKWLNILQNENLNAMTPEDIYRKKRVCHNHFEEKYVSPGTRKLHIDAVPTLFVSNGSASDTGNLLVSPESNMDIPSSNIVVKEEFIGEDATVGTSSNFTGLEVDAQILSEHSYAKPNNNNIMRNEENSSNNKAVPSSKLAVHADNQVISGKNEGKTEDIDILEQFIDENGIHDRKEYGMEGGINISGPSEQLHEAEDPSDLELSECAVNRKSNLKELNLKKHKCELCHYATSKKIYLKHHIDSVHVKLNQHKCELCDYVASQKCNLKKHIISVHLNLKQYKCELCDYTARQEVHLKQHITSIHLNLKQHKCEVCDFAANQAGNLKCHVNTVHLNLKQHICHLCEYAVDRNCDLQKHIESVHFKLKQHKCVFCDYATNGKNNLKKHVESVHWNLKEFKCDICGFAASQRPDLKKHVESVHLKLKKYKCILCDYAAYRSVNLKKHIKTIHT